MFPLSAGVDGWQTCQSCEEQKDLRSAFIWNRDRERGCCHDNDLLSFSSVLFVGPTPQRYDGQTGINVEAVICPWLWLINVLGLSWALS